jgi:hypothetical protein
MKSLFLSTKDKVSQVKVYSYNSYTSISDLLKNKEIFITLLTIIISIIILLSYFLGFNHVIKFINSDYFNYLFTEKIYSTISVITHLTPVFQILILAGFGIYTIISILSRIIPGFGRLIWNNEWLEASAVFHTITFTTVPHLVFILLLLQVIYHWNPTSAALGEWSIPQVIIAVFTFTTGFVLFILSAYLKERVINIDDPSKFTSWIPLIFRLSGIFLIIFSILFKLLIQ